MPAAQLLLFPDARPLVERLGRDFFRQAPECPGVYMMRDRAEQVLYVGTAKNLRNRLRSYRVANPDRMPRRHLRLVRAVARIELECCLDERAALAREAHLLLALKPRFNRTGTWHGPRGLLRWHCADDALELTVSRIPENELGSETAPLSTSHAPGLRVHWFQTAMEPAAVMLGVGWKEFGPLALSTAQKLRNALARLLWSALCPECKASQMPAGWLQNRFPTLVRVAPTESLRRGSKSELAFPAHSAANSALRHAAVALQQVCAGQPDAFCDWVEAQRQHHAGFDRLFIDRDLEVVRRLGRTRPQEPNPAPMELSD